MLNTILTIAKLLPAIIQMVQAVEAALPASGQGAAKLELVVQILQLGEGVVSPDIATKLINLVVGFFNKTGAFTK